jgi:hypothetical protein
MKLLNVNPLPSGLASLMILINIVSLHLHERKIAYFVYFKEAKLC